MNHAMARLAWHSTRVVVAVLSRLCFRSTDRSGIQRILIFRTGQLGDTLCALPAISHIRSAFPRARITALTDSRPRSGYVESREVIGLTGNVDDYLLFDPTKIRQAGYRRRLELEIRSRRFDLLIYLGQSSESFFRLVRNLVWWRWKAGIKAANGFVKNYLNGRLEESFVSFRPPLKETDRLLENLRSGSVAIPKCDNPKFKISRVQSKKVESILVKMRGHAICTVAPGSKMPVKRWEEEKYEELGRRLLGAFPDLFLLVVGDKNDVLMGDRLVQSWGERSYNSAGMISIAECYTLLTSVQLFVGNDSGVMHLAAAAGAPCVAVFTAREPQNQWYPYGDKHQVIRHETECHYCRLEDCIAERARCIQSIQIAEVYSAACAVLRSASKEPPEGAAMECAG